LRTAELRGASLLGSQQQDRLLVWHVYWINGSWTASDSVAKLYGALYRLLGRGDDAAVVMVYAPKGQAGEGEAALAAFMQANGAAIAAVLHQTRAQR